MTITNYDAARIRTAIQRGDSDCQIAYEYGVRRSHELAGMAPEDQHEVGYIEGFKAANVSTISTLAVGAAVGFALAAIAFAFGYDAVCAAIAPGVM